jgi:hypothetical protein
VGVDVGVTVALAVGVDVGVAVGVNVGLGETVAVGVAVEVGTTVGSSVAVGVTVGLATGVAPACPPPPLQAASKLAASTGPTTVENARLNGTGLLLAAKCAAPLLSQVGPPWCNRARRAIRVRADDSHRNGARRGR